MNGYGYDLTQKYEDNFRDDTEFNAESIWEINYDAKGNSGDAWGNGTSDDSFMGNNLAHYFGPTLKGENIGGGWYKMQPSPYLIKNSFPNSVRKALIPNGISVCTLRASLNILISVM